MYSLKIDPRASVEKNLESILSQCCIVDIETSAFYPNGEEINIQSDFENYLKYAQVKWIGFYSFKYQKTFTYNTQAFKPNTVPNAFQEKTVEELFSEHPILIGHNCEDFDLPILVNNKFIIDPSAYLIIDTMIILGKSSFRTKKGFPYKNRATLMEVDLDSNSLKNMGKAFNLEIQKGDIDYKIFQKDVWTHQETQEIIKYLTSDILTTKSLFNKIWDYWKPFTKFLPNKSIYDLSWIKGSIASVIYKSVCHLLGEDPTYSERGNIEESMGGNVYLPSIEEETEVFICDFSSLYPHIFSMFNLFSEMEGKFEGKYVFHGNDIFQVKGYYDSSRPSVLSKLVIDFLQKRMELKKNDPDNPLIYTYKIFLNGLYGIVRSKIFEKVYKPNAGWDCCWLGQQCQELIDKMLTELGWVRIAGDTDSWMGKHSDPTKNTKEYLRECLNKVVQKIKDNAPFKVNTFDIVIEKKVDYIMFPFSEQPIVGEDGKNLKVKNRLIKERKPKKKNYLYIYENKGVKEIELKGLPIIKDNATKLGMDIYENVLKKKIIEQNRAKFLKEDIDTIINDYLKKPDILDTISVEYKVKSLSSYKTGNPIHAQISKAYFGGNDGVIRLIKNNKIGKVGKSKVKYCSIEEAQEAKLLAEDLDLTKLYEELSPFILFTLGDAKNQTENSDEGNENQSIKSSKC